ncbi:MAG TPA: response regulator [Chloroflexota bacterium]
MAQQNGGHRVVIVDDDSEFLALMRTLLVSEGEFEVITHPRAEDAQPLIARARPDLVVLDLVTNRQERGWALIEELRADRATAGVPIVLCSAAIRSLDRRAGWLAEQGVAVVAKPFELDDLMDAIWRGLGQE